MIICNLGHMFVYNGLDKIQNGLDVSVLTIGNFDGVHLGHQRVLAELIRQGKSVGASPVVITFDPHPSQILRPTQKVPMLFSRQDLKEQLERFGVQHLVIEPFTEAFAQMPAAEFIEELVHTCRPKVMIVGYDFTFGYKRLGNFHSIQEWGERLGYLTMRSEAVLFDGEVVSSSRIRAAIAGGAVDLAQALLGRTFYLQGHIVPGEGRGRKIGIATANLQTAGEVWPRRGVYFTQFIVRGQALPALTNVGHKPTFHDKFATTIETHVLNSSENYYDETVRVCFLKKLRDEIKFASAQELVQQIQSDVVTAKIFFGV